MPYDPATDDTPVAMNIMGQPVTEQQYYRAQAKSHGYEPDEWEAVRDMMAQGRAFSEANPPIYGTVEYASGSGTIRRRQYLGNAQTLNGLDTEKLQGMRSSDPMGDSFSNEHGTFTRARGPSSDNPLGKNATFNGKEAKYWGYVQENAQGRKYVPGWNTSAMIIGHPDGRSGIGGNRPESAYGDAWYSNLDTGTAVGPMLQQQGYDLSPRKGGVTVTRLPSQGGGSPAPGATPGGGNGGVGAGGGGGTGGPGHGFPGPAPTGPQPTPGTNPATHGPGVRPTMDYGPSPVPVATSDPRSPSQRYQTGGSAGTDYSRPVFGGPSQWNQAYNDFVMGGGIDISRYMPEAGAPAGDQQAAPQMTQQQWNEYYNRYLQGQGGG